MSSIKKFNVKINDSTSESFDVGANATNVDFSNNAPAPFNNNTLEKVNSNAENAVPEEINSKASNKIYDGAHIRNVSPDNVDQASAEAALNGHRDYTNRDETNQGSGAFTISYGIGCLARGHNSTAIGFDCEANGWASFAEGWKSKTGNMSNYAHAEGARTEANHNAAHAEGDNCIASGYGSHAEGRGTTAAGVASHSEGSGNTIEATVVREGSNTVHGSEIADDIDIELGNKEKGIAEDAFKTNRSYINGQGSHVEGTKNTVQGAYCHAEGMSNRIEKVYGSTVMGELNVVKGDCSVAMGYNNVIDGGQNNLVLGSFNTLPSCSDCLVIGKCARLGADNSSTAAFIIGGGTEGANSNLLTVYRPASGYANLSNRGSLYGEHVDSHFNQVYTQKLFGNGDTTSSSNFVPAMPRPLIKFDNVTNFRFVFEQTQEYSVIHDWSDASAILPVTETTKIDPNYNFSTANARLSYAIFNFKDKNSNRSHSYLCQSVIESGGGESNQIIIGVDTKFANWWNLHQHNILLSYPTVTITVYGDLT